MVQELDCASEEDPTEEEADAAEEDEWPWGRCGSVLHVQAKQPSQDAAVSNLILVGALSALLLGIAFIMTAAAHAELLGPMEKMVRTMDQVPLPPCAASHPACHVTAA